MLTHQHSRRPLEGLGILRVSQKCCLLPVAATLLPGDRPVQATWDLEMGQDEQELPGVSGGQCLTNKWRVSTYMREKGMLGLKQCGEWECE